MKVLTSATQKKKKEWMQHLADMDDASHRQLEPMHLLRKGV